MKTLKEVLKNPPMQTYQHFPDAYHPSYRVDYNLWCKQVREAVAQCTECGKKSEDALYIDDHGPFCNQCYYEFDEDMKGV